MKVVFRKSCKIFLQTFLWFALYSGLAQGAQQNLTNLADRRPYSSKNTYRSIDLENGLKVLLISNPDRTKASASMDVGVGSLAEPKEFPGLSHFLEHLLFLGTEKYPDVGEYSAYIDRYQGSNNAYTDKENTNYQFEINHEGLAEALDRFAHFFIDPKFTAEFVDKERKAVNDEAAMYKNEDNWKALILHSRLMDPKHALHRYHPGDLETLSKISRDDVKRFYEAHYSSADMSLVIDSRFRLDTMEAWVRSIFTAIPNRGVKKEIYPSTLFEAEQLPLMVEVKSRKDKKILNLIFYTKNLESEWPSKPDHLITHLLGHEGEGSLLASLKQDGLAYGLSAGFHGHSFASMCDVEIELSALGLRQWQEVVQRFFSYVALLKERGVPSYIYDEVAKMAELTYLYHNENVGNALAVVVSKAEKLRKYPALEIDQRTSLLFSYEPGKVQEVLTDIHPENMTIMLSHPQVEAQLREPDFDTPYNRVMIAPSDLESWKQARPSQGLHLPAPNRYIPSNNDEDLIQEAPELLSVLPYGTFWFQADRDLAEPKAKARILIITPGVNKTHKDRAFAALYEYAIKEALNQWSYELALAGIGLSLSAVQKGIQIDVSGFCEKIPSVLTDLSKKLRDLDLTEEKFFLYREKVKSSFSNFFQDQPYKQLAYELSHLLILGHIHLGDIYNPYFQINTDTFSMLTLRDFKTFTNELYRNVAVEGSAYGQLDKKKLQMAVIEMMASGLQASPLSRDDRFFPEEKIRWLKKDQEVSYNLPTAMGSHAYIELVQWGKRSPSLDAKMRLGMAFLETDFFESLRTQQNLGYVVSAARYPRLDMLGLRFLVQSTDHNPSSIKEKMDIWKVQAASVLEGVSSQDFLEAQNAVMAEVMKRPRTLEERFAALDAHAYVLNENFSYEQDVCAALASLTQAEVVAGFREVLARKPSFAIGMANE